VRIEGLTNSASSFGFKVEGGLGAAIIGWVLSIGGYIGGAAMQPESAVLDI
jgi:GPH family glycoside/pentoside/hexuronide:cation symporter